MAILVLLAVIVAITGGSDATWCVCRSDVSDTALQKTLDYACGAGADCTPILQNGGCFQPNTVRGHCSYAANSFFQKKGQAAGTCDFGGTATISTTDPSLGTCSYPSTASSAGTGTSTTSSSTTTSSTTPNTFTPANGVLGLGPSGSSITTDVSDGGLLPRAGKWALLMALLLPAVFHLRG